MTGHTDWRAQRYAAKSAEWKTGYAAFSPWTQPPPSWGSADDDFLRGWQWAEFEADEARDRAREDRQHYPLSPMSAFERNRP